MGALVATGATAVATAEPEGRHAGAGRDTAIVAFKIYVDESAAYRVGFDELAALSPGLKPVPSRGVAMSHLGQPEAVWLEDGGDGQFGPGDHLEFLGQHLAGDVSYRREEIRFNVYRLKLSHEATGREEAAPDVVAQRDKGRMFELAPTAVADRDVSSRLVRAEHVEKDVLRIRLPVDRADRRKRDELWYWTRIIGGYPPVSHELFLPDLDRRAGGSVELRVQLRGWSSPMFKGDAALPDHRVDLVLNGEVVAEAGWDGSEPHEVTVPDLSATLFVDGPNVLELSSPRRSQADGEQLIDVMLLNWIEVIAPSTGHLADPQAHWRLVEGSDAVTVRADTGRAIRVYGVSGWRLSARDVVSFKPPPSEPSVVAATELVAPPSIVVDRPSDLQDDARQTDYVMIAHRDLLTSTEELAALHRNRGLSVRVVDVEDVFDEFSHGLRDPQAIRSFLAHARDHWSPPAPRFALLVGDASWDVANEEAVDANYADWTARSWEIARFTKNRSTPYESQRSRNLVPTLSYRTNQGAAASDHAFVTATDDPRGRASMAIGRLPVTEPREVAAIVRKTRRYMEEAKPGPWSRRAIFITTEEPAFRARSEKVARSVEARGLRAVEIYTDSSEPSNERHTARLLETLDEGALAVHFYGHGGRYIWRTGPPDLENRHDLLTLDDLERLTPSPHLPVVLSMTCYSAPFDHPTADSIGEKFLRLPDRGAVAVIAASWRNGPRASWGGAILRHLTAPGATVGEALLAAKGEVRHHLFINTYNLLGDPALPVAGVSGMDPAPDYDVQPTNPSTSRN